MNMISIKKYLVLTLLVTLTAGKITAQQGVLQKRYNFSKVAPYAAVATILAIASVYLWYSKSTPPATDHPFTSTIPEPGGLPQQSPDTIPTTVTINSTAQLAPSSQLSAVEQAFAAIKANDFDRFNTLIENGVPADSTHDITDNNGFFATKLQNNSLLHEAAANGNRKMVVLLLNKGASMESLNSLRETPLDYFGRKFYQTHPNDRTVVFNEEREAMTWLLLSRSFNIKSRADFFRKYDNFHYVDYWKNSTSHSLIEQFKAVMYTHNENIEPNLIRGLANTTASCMASVTTSPTVEQLFNASFAQWLSGALKPNQEMSDSQKQRLTNFQDTFDAQLADLRKAKCQAVIENLRKKINAFFSNSATSDAMSDETLRPILQANKSADTAIEALRQSLVAKKRANIEAIKAYTKSKLAQNLVSPDHSNTNSRN